MSDQASILRELAGSTAPRPLPAPEGIPMISVTGGRAGVGATTVALNLAAVLSDRGERVVLVDATEGPANLAQTARSWIAIKHGILEVLAGSCDVADALAPGPAGVLLLARRRSAQTDADFSRHAQQRLLSELQTLHEVASVIVVETGTGLSPWTQRFWLRSRLAILVTTPDDAAIVGTYAVLKRCMADAIAADVRVLANQCDSDTAARSIYMRLSRACEQFLSQTLQTLPSLPMHRAEQRLGIGAAPRVWESPNTAFGHAALWLGQAVSAVLPSPEASILPPRGSNSIHRREFSTC